jgi:hypothetical protein
VTEAVSVGPKMRRLWAMPNKDTFSIPVIGDWVKWYLRESKVSVDPFARNKRWATYTNDLNPETDAEFHMEAEEFLEMLVSRGVKADLVILDPPYSPRQVKECYDDIGRTMAMEDAWTGAVRKRRRELVEKLITPDATVLTFGWNSNGMGEGWELLEILLVAHGSDHNDTICLRERKQALEPSML